jgi:hypothetical protein
MLNKQIEVKTSMHNTTLLAGKLGKALEASGFFSQAAMIYAKAASYMESGCHPNSTFFETVHALHESYWNILKEQGTQLIQLIIDRTNSAQTMREAFLSCSNLCSMIIDVTYETSSNRKHEDKNDACEYFQGKNGGTAGLTASCHACRATKEE